MARFWTTESLDRVAHSTLLWLQTYVLVWSTLLQAACAAVVMGLLGLLAGRVTAAARVAAERLPAGSLRRVGLALAGIVPWLVLLILIWFEELAFAAAHVQYSLLRLVESLALAWVIIRLSSMLVRSPRLARMIAGAAWIFAALNIAGLVAPTAGLLDSMAVSVGALRLSALLVLKGVLLLAVLIWLANLVSRVVDQRLEALSDLTPTMQVLAGKLIRISLLTLAVVLALGAVGIDLTAFAVFSGAIGVGIGFGLQKVVSNLISGVILLLDRSIKPGDVIEIEGTYGWITRLNARFVSVVTRDGAEYLIPNEDLITQRVVNWSYSNDLVRLHVPFGIAYNADVHEAMRLALSTIGTVTRILDHPKPVCLLIGFGESSVNLELRFWIRDPRNGISNVRSEVLLNLWDVYRVHDIELPFPQRDLRFRNPEALAEALARSRPNPAVPPRD
jgi:small-conductance mechanosensitive channel